MVIDKSILTDKAQTGRKMHMIVRRFADDLDRIKVMRRGRQVALSGLSLPEFFDFVRKIKYKRDDAPVELIARPLYIMGMTNKGIDCKKKNILISAYLRKKKIPYRMLAVSTRPDKKVHHVFPQGEFSGQWLNLDATYSNYQPFAEKKVSYAEVLKG